MKLKESLSRQKEDTTLAPIDFDGDGIEDFRDTDTDNDKIPDRTEWKPSWDTSKTLVIDPVDTDWDWQHDWRDVDSDNDGILDSYERKSKDSTEEISPNPIDTDWDGEPDYRDIDSDGDKIPDDTERKPRGSTEKITEQPIDTDWDGTEDFRDIDSDGDTISDETERKNPEDPDILTLNPIDTDGDGEKDFRDLDSDDDWRFDKDEAGDDDIETYPVDENKKNGKPDWRDPYPMECIVKNPHSTPAYKKSWSSEVNDPYNAHLKSYMYVIADSCNDVEYTEMYTGWNLITIKNTMEFNGKKICFKAVDLRWVETTCEGDISNVMKGEADDGGVEVQETPKPQKDVCPDGDYTKSAYDGECGEKPVDNCPDGDYTESKYDWQCGVKPAPKAEAPSYIKPIEKKPEVKKPTPIVKHANTGAVEWAIGIAILIAIIAIYGYYVVNKKK